MPSQITNWGYLFYPVTVIGSAEGTGTSNNRTYPNTDPTSYFVWQTERSLMPAQVEFFQYPYANVEVTTYPDPDTGDPGTAVFFLVFMEDSAAAQLVGQNVTFDDGTSIEITADASTPAGQSFEYPGPDVWPQYVTDLGGLEPA